MFLRLFPAQKAPSGLATTYITGLVEAQSVNVKDTHPHTPTHLDRLMRGAYNDDRVAGSDCVVMYNTINTHTHIHTRLIRGFYNEYY